MDEPEELDFVKNLGHRIARQIPGTRIGYNFFVIRDPTMNAFAVPGGYIYMFAGLLAQVRSVDELAGVMAHEIGHVEGNHFIRGQKKLDITNIATIAATILAATLGGGEEAVAVGTIAQAAQVTSSLHYSRQFEREADRTAIRLVHRSGFHPEGISSLFNLFQAEARLNASSMPPYFSTHPLPSERIQEVQAWIQVLSLAPPREDPIKGFDLARITAKLRTEGEHKALAWQKQRMQKNPDSAHEKFLMGYLYLKMGNLALARQFLEAAFSRDRTAPGHALYLARAYELSGRLEEAGPLLDMAGLVEPQNPLVEVFYGKLMIRHDDWDTALYHFRRAAMINPESSFSHMNLGLAYGRLEQTGKSYYHLGLAAKLSGRYSKALHYYKKALKLVDRKSKDAESIKEAIRAIEG